MPKKWITFGLLGLAGWWLWKNAKKNVPLAAAATPSSDIPYPKVFTKLKTADRKLVESRTAIPVFKKLVVADDLEGSAL